MFDNDVFFFFFFPDSGSENNRSRVHGFMFAHVHGTGFLKNVHTFVCPCVSVLWDYTAVEELSSDLPIHSSPPT